MRVYTAGPMTGLPQFNYPAFIEAAALLRRVDYDVVSPAELDNEASRRAAMASPNGLMSEFNAAYDGPLPRPTWGDFLSRDVKLIADGDEKGPIDAIVVLDGWERSEGAALETFVGFRTSKPILWMDGPREDFYLIPVPFLNLVRAWAKKDDISFHSMAEPTCVGMGAMAEVAMRTCEGMALPEWIDHGGEA